MPPLPTPIISQNTSDQHSDRAILYNVIARFENYVFEVDIPPTALGVKAVSYAPRANKVLMEIVAV